MVHAHETGRHGLDAIAIGQWLADIIVWVHSESPAITPAVPRMNGMLCPGHPAMYVADVGLVYGMCDKQLLDGRIGVCMM